MIILQVCTHLAIYIGFSGSFKLNVLGCSIYRYILPFAESTSYPKYPTAYLHTSQPRLVKIAESAGNMIVQRPR
jgi:hypothetical protein